MSGSLPGAWLDVFATDGGAWAEVLLKLCRGIAHSFAHALCSSCAALTPGAIKAHPCHDDEYEAWLASPWLAYADIVAED